MSDFERGLQNSIKDVFAVSDSTDSPKLLGCYFHYVKALIKKAKQLKMFSKNSLNKKTKLLLGLLKLLVHCPSDQNKKPLIKSILSLLILSQNSKHFLLISKRTDYQTIFLKDF